jgi:two-component sensor histidine kinase
MKANHHPLEAARLAALRAYDILDTPRETDFDDIVMLASHICDAPISVINLIDETRQWFKAETGLGVRETPLDTSICAHVILENEFVEIPDTLADPRMSDNPLCLADQGLRFYAGVLLKSRDGYPIGTLCVLDPKPRALNGLQRETLRVLADQVMTQINLRAHMANEKIMRSEMDRRIKNSLQVVSAFVSMERRATQNQDAAASLNRVAQQINSVAALHEQLAIGSKGEIMALGPYLERVASLIGAALPAGVVIIANFEDLNVAPREASIVATIMNELAANASKHSFSNLSGTIAMDGERVGDNGYRLWCRDDAGQTRVGITKIGRAGLGLQILQASARQLGGTMTTAQDDAGYSTRLDLNFSSAG